MSDFVAREFSVTSTNTKFVDATENDRRVFITKISNNDIVFVGFDNVGSSARVTSANADIPHPNFILPADYELWLYAASSITVSLIVTKV